MVANNGRRLRSINTPGPRWWYRDSPIYDVQRSGYVRNAESHPDDRRTTRR
jgi:hypothetical protein